MKPWSEEAQADLEAHIEEHERTTHRLLEVCKRQSELELLGQSIPQDVEEAEDAMRELMAFEERGETIVRRCADEAKMPLSKKRMRGLREHNKN